MADNKKYYYLKLKDNFYDSEEMIILQNMPDGYLYSDILLKLYLRSLKNDGKLMFKDVIPYTPEVLAQVVRHQIGTVERAIKIFKQLGLIEVLDNGAMYMTEIQNFIGQSSTEADRKRNYRAKIQNEGKMLLGQTGGQTGGQMSANCPDKSTPEIEIELEIEKDIDIDINKKKNTKKKTTTKTFKKPTVEEIKQYCIERKNNIDPEHFFDYYEANGWKVGKNSMKDWKASVRTWERSSYKNNSSNSSKSSNNINWAEWDKKHASNTTTTREDIQKMIDEGEIF